MKITNIDKSERIYSFSEISSTPGIYAPYSQFVGTGLIVISEDDFWIDFKSGNIERLRHENWGLTTFRKLDSVTLKLES